MLRLASCLVVLLGVSQASAEMHEWPVAGGGNGHVYEFVTQSANWDSAKSLAESRTYLGIPGHLVTITSLEENLFIQQFLGDNAFWIGLTDDETYGGSESGDQPNPQVDGWVWVTGEPVSFTNWAAGEPNNQVPDLQQEDAVEIYPESSSFGLGTWNDKSPTRSKAFIVEYPVPEPSTIILLLTGALGFLLYRRR